MTRHEYLGESHKVEFFNAEAPPQVEVALNRRRIRGHLYLTPFHRTIAARVARIVQTAAPLPPGTWSELTTNHG